MSDFIREEPVPAVVRPEVKLIRRDEIPTLTSVRQDGEVHNLGILKDFRKHPDLNRFIPSEARLSMAWVNLGPGEVLTTHVHDTGSMIVMARGEGRIVGDLEAHIEEGDIILIPGGCHHGFIGGGEHGYWALSIQFEGLGLYEDPERARVRFEGSAPRAMAAGLRRLLDENARYAAAYRNNKLVQLATSGRLTDKHVRARLFDCVQVWASRFQKAMFARSATTDDPRFQAVFWQHIKEEFGHDDILQRERGAGANVVWDPVLDAACNWFCWRMLTSDNVEKVVLVHLVLEVSSNVISPLAGKAVNGYGEVSYFAIHEEADDAHAVLGIDLLEGLDERAYLRLSQVLKEGWDVLNVLCARMAELCDGI